MKSKNYKQLNGLLALLSPAAPDNPDAVQKEPLTLHRRGHWFKSSIAHHRKSCKKVTSLQYFSFRFST
ncbi:hypothetical protein ACFLX0_02240 [Chloroflexota bacterium]